MNINKKPESEQKIVRGGRGACHTDAEGNIIGPQDWKSWTFACSSIVMRYDDLCNCSNC